jgi:hypothetical protein
LKLFASFDASRRVYGQNYFGPATGKFEFIAKKKDSPFFRSSILFLLILLRSFGVAINIKGRRGRPRFIAGGILVLSAQL